MENVAQRERRIRDLGGQLSELAQGDRSEISFIHIAERRQPVTLYSTIDGEPVPVPEYMVAAALSKRRDDGEYMFTDNFNEAPTYQRGSVKCFLHADSAERASGILAAIGMAHKVCPAGDLANPHSKRMHGLHRHKQEWGALQEHISDQKEREQEARQEAQLEATLAIARQAGAQAGGTCDICGKDGLKNVGAHKRTAHK